jgi:hypothetical protein
VSNYLADENAISYGGVLNTVFDNRANRTVETQFLDGSFNIQTIGTAPRRLQVQYTGSHATRLLLEALADEGGILKVYWKDTIYTGIISGSVSWTRHSRDRAEFAEQVTFQVLVSAEASQ